MTKFVYIYTIFIIRI